MRQIPLRSIRWLTALLMAGSFATVGQAQEVNADLQGISRMVKQGQRPAALARLNTYLAKNPKDISARFMKGVLLVEQAEQGRSKDPKEARDPNRYREAISVFYGIIKDHPERPEPYNNLAAIYASLDQWDKSKEMLEAAIRTNPSYATAHENLGDVYAKLASQAYEKALQLDTSSPAVQNKLRMIGDLFPHGSGGQPKRAANQPQPARTTVAAVTPPAAVTSPSRGAASLPAATVPPAAYPNNARSTSGAFKPTPAGNVAAATPPALDKPAPDGRSAEQKVAKAEPKTNEAPSQEGTSGVLDVVHGWATAWSKQDVPGYMGYYADNFKPSGQSREAWQKQRERRLTRPKSIQVDVASAKVQVKGDRAVVTFKQTYESDVLGRDSIHKRLILVKENGQWRILRESGR